MKLNKKGFTLVELLAVIVVLGLVTVIGATTVLPLLGKSQKNALATEANSLAESASQAVSLISIGSYDGTKTDVSNGYCFTVTDLINAGLWKKKDDTGYSGTVTVTKAADASAYTYKVSLTNGKYTISSVTGNVDVDDVKDYNNETFKCS